MTVFISHRYANVAGASRLDLFATFGNHIVFRGAAQLCHLIDTVKPGCVFVDGEQDEAILRLAEMWGGQIMPRWTPPKPPDPPNLGALVKAMVDLGIIPPSPSASAPEPLNPPKRKPKAA